MRPRPSLLRRLAPLAIVLGLVPGGAAAHPHVFIDGGVDFIFDGEGRLEHLRITWTYDVLSSLFMLEDLELGQDPSGVLDAEALAALAAYQTRWIEGFDGDSYLWDAGRRIGLSGPLSAEAGFREGQVEIRFLRAVETPFVPGPETVVKVYDPGYFTAYAVTLEPALEGAPDGCTARVVPFTPTGPLAAIQQSLFAIPMDEDPEDSNVGALFADEVFVSCD